MTGGTATLRVPSPCSSSSDFPSDSSSLMKLQTGIDCPKRDGQGKPYDGTDKPDGLLRCSWKANISSYDIDSIIIEGQPVGQVVQEPVSFKRRQAIVAETDLLSWRGTLNTTYTMKILPNINQEIRSQVIEPLQRGPFPIRRFQQLSLWLEVRPSPKCFRLCSRS